MLTKAVSVAYHGWSNDTALTLFTLESKFLAVVVKAVHVACMFTVVVRQVDATFLTAVVGRG